MLNKKILVVGTDKRLVFANDSLLNKNFNSVHITGNSFNELKNMVNDFDYLLLPIPFTRDNRYINGTNILICDFLKCNLKDKVIFVGALNEKMSQLMKSNNINYIDYYNDEYFAKFNAIPTSEGAIQIIINNTVITISNSNILIVGYGKVAKDLAKKLFCLGANITIAARNNNQRKMAKELSYNAVYIEEIYKLANKVDIVVNTPNAYIFNEELFNSFSKDVMFLELASNPGGFSFDTKGYDNIFIERGLPAKVAPKTAGEYIVLTIVKYIMEG